MNYNLLYQGVFCLAFLNFFIHWIDLFFFSFSSNIANSLKINRFITWLPINTQKQSTLKKNLKEKIFFAKRKLKDLFFGYVPIFDRSLIDRKRARRDNYFLGSIFDRPKEIVVFLYRLLIVKRKNKTVWKKNINQNSLSFSSKRKEQFSEDLLLPSEKMTLRDKKNHAISLQSETGWSGAAKFTSMKITKFIISLTLWCSLTLLIIFRYIQSNHFPLSNFYEALIFLTWSLVTLNFIILFEPFNYKIRPFFFELSNKKKNKNFYEPFNSSILSVFPSSDKHLCFKNVQLQPIVSLNIKAWQPYIKTNENFLNQTKEFSKNLQFFILLTKTINISSKYYKKFGISLLYDIFVLKKIHTVAASQKKNFFDTLYKQSFCSFEDSQKYSLFYPILKNKSHLPSQREGTLSSQLGRDGFRSGFFLPKKQKIKDLSFGYLFGSSFDRSTDMSYFRSGTRLEEVGKRKNQEKAFAPSEEIKKIKHNEFIDEQKKKEAVAPSEQEKKIYGGILAPCILFILGFAQFNLSSEFTPLVPALKSNWLFMHVSIMICSYTTFIVGGLISLILLIQIFFASNHKNFFSLVKKKTLANQVNMIFSNIINKKNDHYNFIFPNLSNKAFLCSGEREWRERLEVTKLKIKKSLPIQQSLFTDFQRLLHLQWKNTKENLKFFNIQTKRPFLINKISIENKPDVKTRRSFSVDQKLTENEHDVKTKSWQQLKNKIKVSANKSSVFREILIFRGAIDNSPRVYKDNLFIQQPSFFSKTVRISKKKNSDFNITLDNLSYRMFGIGFPLFTLGLLSGAVWANSAWGSYWSWDIKEVGSFIHWLVLTFYFHCRYKNYITFSHLVGFFSLLILFFNFFGVSLGLYGSSLHAYS